MLGGKEVQLYLLFMLRKLHGKNPLNAYQVKNKSEPFFYVHI